MLRINDEAPNFTAETSQGTINFHEWMGDGWAILFSHPKDFTPVCTTELGYMAGLQPEFEKRNTKIIALSVDPVSSHGKWAADIEETQGHKVNYPMIGDPELKIAKLYDMLPADAGNTSEGRTPAANATVRTVFVIGPDKKIKLMLSYPMSTGRNFDEVLRVVDSMQLTAKHKVSTPVNWKPGEDVIILPAVSDEEAKQKYPERLEITPAVYADRSSTEVAAASEGGVILKQFYLPCLAHASYVIGDEATGTAAVVDPQRDIDQYLAFAAEHDLAIKHVFLTHLHADFIAGHLELRDRAGAAICLGAAARAQYPFTPFHDGDILEFGRVRMKVLETPGHTPESISIVIYDLNTSATQPHAVLTGDTLFIGDVGRPDLRAALGWSTAALGSMLFDSLHMKLLALPDQSLVYPAHGAGSLCGKALSKETVSTLGEQRRSNYALQPMSKEAFIAMVSADQPEAPAYFNYDAVLNSEERPTLDETLARVNPVTLDDLLTLQAAGAQVLDTRDPGEFAAAHLAGSINIGLGGQYATWAGTVLDREHPIVIIADPGRENESTTRLGRIGFDHVVGYLQHGLHSLKARPDLTITTERLSAPFAAELLSSSEAPLAIDVRAPGERGQKYIGGSLGMPLNHLRENVGKLPRDRALLVYCAGGYRSSIAASLLRRSGFDRVSEIAGGIVGWEAAKLPVQTTPA